MEWRRRAREVIEGYFRFEGFEISELGMRGMDQGRGLGHVQRAGLWGIDRTILGFGGLSPFWVG